MDQSFQEVDETSRLFGLRNRRFGRTAIAIYVNKPREHFELRPAEFSRLLE